MILDFSLNIIQARKQWEHFYSTEISLKNIPSVYGLCPRKIIPFKNKGEIQTISNIQQEK